MGVALTDVFETLQVYLGSLYVNDFNRFGRTYQVIAQADAPFRADAADDRAAQDAQRRGRDGAARLAGDGRADASGPTGDALQRLSRGRHQRRAAARLLARARPRPRSRRCSKQTLPRGMSYEWTELTYQDS